MDIKEFNQKPEEEQIKLLKRRVEEMKKSNLKTLGFQNEEFEFAWPSSKIRDLGYWYDSMNKCLLRYARKNEMVITKKEYESLTNGKEYIPDNSEFEKTIAKQQKEIDALKMQLKNEKSGDSDETLITPYLDGETTAYYVKIPKKLIPIWNEFVTKQVYGKQHTFEIALMKFIKQNEERVTDIDLLNELADSEIEYHTISICLCKKIIDEWRNYCKSKARFISINLLTTVALMQMMEINDIR